MRCKICDRVLETPNFSSDHDEYDPCEACLVVIKETLEGYKDNAFVAEDDLGMDETEEYYYRVYGLREEDIEL